MPKRTKLDEYPAWVCADCGKKHGHMAILISTYHVGSQCGWCGRMDVPVTEPRDWGYPTSPMDKKRLDELAAQAQQLSLGY